MVYKQNECQATSYQYNDIDKKGANQRRQIKERFKRPMIIRMIVSSNCILTSLKG